MNHTKGMRGPIRISHHAVGQNPAGLRGTSDGCFRSCSASTALELLLRLVHQHRDFGLELCKFCVGCLGQCSDDEQRARVQGVESDPHDISRRRRFTRFRTTAFPTALDTMKPTRAAWESSVSIRLCAIKWAERTRTPALKTLLKSSPLRIR